MVFVLHEIRVDIGGVGLERTHVVLGIAHTLNSEGVLAPQPQKGRFSRSWCLSSVRHVLLNRKYVGKTIWNTKRKLRVPGTSKRVYRPRPESEWATLDTPHLRIVSDELFAAAGRRFEKAKQTLGRPGQESSGLIVGPRRYLFSGLLKCAECGGSITLVSGRGRNGADRYGCSLHHQRGVTVCSNSRRWKRSVMESIRRSAISALPLSLAMLYQISSSSNSTYGASR